MRTLRGALLAAAPALLLALPHAARAAGDYVVDGVQINGNSLMSTETIQSALQAHPGARVTKDDILGDRDAIAKLYADKHMGVRIRTALAAKGGNHVTIIYTLAETAAPQPVQTAQGLKLGTVSLTGNSKVSSSDLQAALGEQPGTPVTEDSLAADMKKLQSVYTAKDVGVAISYSATYPQAGVADITWKLDETNAPQKKKRPKILEDTDQGYKTEAPGN